MANVNPKNQATIQGRLGQDAVLRNTNDGKPVLNLSVAVSNDWFDKEQQEWVPAEPTWVPVTLWGQSAEWYAEQMKKGTLVRVMGKLSTRKRTIEQEVTIGTGKSAKTGTARIEVTEMYVTAASIEVIPTQSATNSQVPRQSSALALTEPDF